MPLSIASLVAAVGPSVYQYIKGSGQEDKADELAKTPRPKYHRPGEIDEFLGLTRAQAGQNRYAGQTRDEENVGGNLATGIKAATEAGGSSAGVLATLGGLNNNANQANQAIAEKGIQYQERNKERYGEALKTGAEYTDKEFDYNQTQPYQTAIQASAALRNQGEQNQSNALTNIGTADVDGLTGGLGSKLGGWLGGLFGGKSSSGTTASNTSNLTLNSPTPSFSAFPGQQTPNINGMSSALENSSSGMGGMTFGAGDSPTVGNGPALVEMFGKIKAANPDDGPEELTRKLRIAMSAGNTNMGS